METFEENCGKLNMKMKSQIPSPAAVKCREAITAAINPFAKELSGSEILAILSYTVGQVIAMQDQTKMTPDMAMELVQVNIEAGNAMVINELMAQNGGTS